MDEFLPQDKSVNLKELQLFFKRLRKNTNQKIKYFACGEYGEKFKRPHYHAIVLGLGLSDEEKSQVQYSWHRGIVHFGTIDIKSMKYVTGYMLKGSAPEGCIKPFQTMSKSLGKRFAIDNQKYLLQDASFTVNGVRQTLPRYYTKILDIPNELKERKFSEVERKKYDEFKKRKYPNSNAIISDFVSRKEQRELNELAKLSQKKERKDL